MFTSQPLTWIEGLQQSAASPVHKGVAVDCGIQASTINHGEQCAQLQAANCFVQLPQHKADVSILHHCPCQLDHVQRARHRMQKVDLPCDQQNFAIAEK
jgi:hypothetical protein